MTRVIALSGGLQTFVDDEDFDWLSQFSWNPREGRNGHFYAARMATYRREDGTIQQSSREMQRDLLDPDRELPGSVLIDHRDRDTLNNQKYNLRVVNYSTSNLNRSLFRNNTTGYRWVQRQGRLSYKVQVRKDRQLFTPGRVFRDVHDAAEAANELALRVLGPDVVLNIIRRD